MRVFEAHITNNVAIALGKLLGKVPTFASANVKLWEAFGIKVFFASQSEYDLFKSAISSPLESAVEEDRAEYGDFQTNIDLAGAVTSLLKNRGVEPEIIVEPTCGKGNFILAAIKAFPKAQKIVGVEIYKVYAWETKFNIVEYYLGNPQVNKPNIEIHQFNVFDFDFKKIIGDNFDKEILIIGNPPWVTNSKLSSLESNNLPNKSNFKNHRGFDAITGKGNFDIGEYITLMMLDAFQHLRGQMALLVKSSVIKNILYDQKVNNYKISQIQKLTIDSKKEFDVSVEAGLLYCELGSNVEFTCREYSLYNPTISNNEFGWLEDKFVSDVENYFLSSDIDGHSPFEWRQGVKHDLSSIMELEQENDYFLNGLNEKVELEDGLVYGLLKSSDLKRPVINDTRKFTIITQKKIGEDTTFIKQAYPKTYAYLSSHTSRFSDRKSGIYKNKPEFSIFGVGDYSFKPYKVSISGFYKTFDFSLVLPSKGKPIMLDDTCYLLGFDRIEFAAYTLILLNSEKSCQLLKSITFSDAKRIFTKDILMRIDLRKLAAQFTINELQIELSNLSRLLSVELKLNFWKDFLESMEPVSKGRQISIFD